MQWDGECEVVVSSWLFLSTYSSFSCFFLLPSGTFRSSVHRLQSFRKKLLQGSLSMQFHGGLSPGSCVQSSIGSKGTTFFACFPPEAPREFLLGCLEHLLSLQLSPQGSQGCLFYCSLHHSLLYLMFPRHCHQLWGSARPCGGLVGADRISFVPREAAPPHRGHLHGHCTKLNYK